LGRPPWSCSREYVDRPERGRAGGTTAVASVVDIGRVSAVRSRPINGMRLAPSRFSRRSRHKKRFCQAPGSPGGTVRVPSLPSADRSPGMHWNLGPRKRPRELSSIPAPQSRCFGPPSPGQVQPSLAVFMECVPAPPESFSRDVSGRVLDSALPTAAGQIAHFSSRISPTARPPLGIRRSLPLPQQVREPLLELFAPRERPATGGSGWPMPAVGGLFSGGF
jgi:hypothetical protein